MNRRIIWTTILCMLAGILQSTLLAKVSILGVVPDVALCIVVYCAYINGTMTGQLSGFLSGLLLDFLSAAPLGLNCLVRTLIGALAGVFKGALFLDYLLMPVILCALATIIKAVIIFILHLFMGSLVQAYSLTTPVFWIELGFNAVSAPLLFLLLRRLTFLTPGRNE